MRIQIVIICSTLLAASSQYEVTQNQQNLPPQTGHIDHNQGKKLEFTPDLSHFRGMYPKAMLQDLGEVSHGQDDSGKVIKVTRTYAIKVPVPYPVKIHKNVPYPVPVPKPYPVHITKIVKVSQPVPIEVPVPVKIPVENHQIKYDEYEKAPDYSSENSYGYQPQQSGGHNYQSQSDTSGHYDSNSASAMYYPQHNQHPQFAYIMPSQNFHDSKSYETQIVATNPYQATGSTGMYNLEDHLMQQLGGSNYPKLDLYSLLSQMKDSQSEYSHNYKRHNKNGEAIKTEN